MKLSQKRHRQAISRLFKDFGFKKLKTLLGSALQQTWLF
jgi:hypothetical protein